MQGVDFYQAELCGALDEGLMSEVMHRNSASMIQVGKLMGDIGSLRSSLAESVGILLLVASGFGFCSVLFSAPDGRAFLLAEPLGSAVDRRAYFLLVSPSRK
ncbi:MAG TPA: hypothetical protein PLN02_08805 [Azonexus sp.]|nr:hypothetical protein [Azonexus sp.]